MSVEPREITPLPVVRQRRAQKMRDVILSIDRNGLLWVVEFRHPYINRSMQILSRAGDWDVWTALILLLLARPGKARRVGFAIMPRILGSLAICFSLKRMARRSRPSTAVEGFSALIIDPDPYSFPSSHAACSWAACLAAARVIGGVGWLLPFYAALVSYSRIHVGAHYPLDVVIGSAIGSSVGMS